MSDLLKSGAAWLAGQMTNFAASAVTYSRAADSSTLETEDIPATVGRTPYEVAEVNGQLTSFTAVDFLISPALLVLNGTATEPRVGDRITDEDGAVFEVMKPDINIPCFALVDHGSRYRIHTKRVVAP